MFQVEGVRLFNAHDFFEAITSGKDYRSGNLQAFENGEFNPAKQVAFKFEIYWSKFLKLPLNLKKATHSLDAARLIEIDLKACLLNLTKELFGKGKFL